MYVNIIIYSNKLLFVWSTLNKAKTKTNKKKTTRINSYQLFYILHATVSAQLNQFLNIFYFYLKFD